MLQKKNGSDSWNGDTNHHTPVLQQQQKMYCKDQIWYTEREKRGRGQNRAGYREREGGREKKRKNLIRLRIRFKAKRIRIQKQTNKHFAAEMSAKLNQHFETNWIMVEHIPFSVFDMVHMTYLNALDFFCFGRIRKQMEIR